MGFISKAIISDDCILRNFSLSEEADSMVGLIPINSVLFFEVGPHVAQAGLSLAT